MDRTCRTLLSITSSLALAAHPFAQTFVRSVPGPAANARFGHASIAVPDMNGDGYKDVLVGAPGFNQDRGAIYCVSGAYLATGAGSSTLWSLAPSANQGDMFGYALADVGDITGDGVHDFLVGQPGYDVTSMNDVGAVRLVSGSAHSVLSTLSGGTQGYALGCAVAATGDVDGDGKSEALIGAPGLTPSPCRLYYVGGNHLTSTGSISTLCISSTGTGMPDALGAAIASDFDLDSDGTRDFVVGSPGFDGPAGADTGAVWVGMLAPNGLILTNHYVSTVPGERFGASVDGGYDFDRDMLADIVVGAPNSPDAMNGEAGRVAVLSGIGLLYQTPPYEIYTFTHPNAGSGDDMHFGAAVRIGSDLNGDHISEIFVGAPELIVYSGLTPLLKGNVSIYSGATGTRLASITGGFGDHFGDFIAGGVDDFDGDGFDEFVVAGSLANSVLTAHTGVIRCYRMFPLSPSVYCTSKVNSLGCAPSIAFSGSPKAVPSAPFTVSASNFVNQKAGLLFYSHAPTAALFQGGTKCAADPVRRCELLVSGGSSSGADCTGTYSVDFNARIASGVDPSLVAGAEIYAQYWSRDPASASHTGLSNAVRFVINP